MNTFTERQKWALDKFDELASQLGSANQAAARIGMSGGTISGIKNGTYKADPTKQLDRLIAYFENKEAAAAAPSYDSSRYVKTSISDNVYDIIRNCHLKGGLAIACGDAGIGKTQAAKQYAKDYESSCIYITVNPCIKSPKSVLKLLGSRFNVSASSIDELWLGIVGKLSDGSIIIIDEAQHLGIRTIETLRSFSDYFDGKGQTLGICFIGNQETVGRLGGKQKAEFAQIRNRTKQTKIYSSKQIKRKDMELLFPQLIGKEMELDFMLKISHSQQAIRGAVNLFSHALDNEDISYKGLVGMAKYMEMAV
ncbi:AAA family ATPase [Ruminococcus flavefaciens]|uniref:AAA family ATPase n=1 Tax=Ruminococcus flavefaciens TaxID=1265 RepID=UPI0026EE1707|nr:AAA family ATPase [Ruminococcus flavefaciens]